MRACDRCGSTHCVRRYMNAFLCPVCAGRPIPDPARTMAALTAAHQARMHARVKTGHR